MPVVVNNDSVDEGTSEVSPVKTPKGKKRKSKAADENLSPNNDTPTRRSARATRQSTGKQQKLTDMFGKKRPRDEEDLATEERSVKPKMEDESDKDKHMETDKENIVEENANKDEKNEEIKKENGDEVEKKVDETKKQMNVDKKQTNDDDEKMNVDDVEIKDEEQNVETKDESDKTKEESDKTKEQSDETKEQSDETKQMTDETKEESDKTKESDETNEDSKETKEETDDNATVSEKTEPPVELCRSCCQNVNDPEVKYYQGHPQDSMEEYIALTDDKLVLTTSDEGDITERPHVNITGFTIYDREGHLCPIDGGLIEDDVRLFMSGYLKSICSDSPCIDEEAVPVKDVGPIIEWGIHGFDGGQQNCIILSTEYGEYNLLKPSDDYSCIMAEFYEKIRISKVTIEYLEEFYYLQPTYEDLLLVIKETSIPELGDKMMTEEMLHKHARFICEQVVSLEVDDEDDQPLITLPCMRELIKLFGIKFGKKKNKTKLQYKKKAPPAWTKATTTPLVRNTFETFFQNQLDKQNEKDLVIKRKRCGICEACQLPDCGSCKACKAMIKFGGSGKTKKACIRRNCPNMAVEQAEESDPEDEEEYRELSEKNVSDDSEENVPVKLSGAGVKTVTWIGEPIKTEMNKSYYERVKVDNLEISVGDFVMVDTVSPNIPHLITKVLYMWKEAMTPKAGFFHGEVFFRSSETVLGESGDPCEVFLADRCCNRAPLSSVLRKTHVTKKDIPMNWFNLGGFDVPDDIIEEDGSNYFYQKFYDKLYARFEDLPIDSECPNEARKHRFCPSCDRKSKKSAMTIPKVFNKLEIKSEEAKSSNKSEWEHVKWRDSEFKKGCGVFLKPGTFRLKNEHIDEEQQKAKLEKVDETVYTEYYRKSESMRGSNIDTLEPFCVGYIQAVLAKGDGPLIIPQDIYLKVNILYRPENTCKEDYSECDLNMLYWSEEQREIPFSAVMGLCKIVYIDNIPPDTSIMEWSSQDFNKFYFRTAYNKSECKFFDVPDAAKFIGESGLKKEKMKGKGKGKGKSSKPVVEEEVKPEVIKVEPLRALDVFAGCGGLSEGLHQSGIAVSKWAIEQMPSAARAYQLNNPKCTVYTEDCNALLKSALDGEECSAQGQTLPRKGDVELLCGGPPCQGFSGMNRFNSREYSNFKNSLVASFLSYCDYYRPKYFILENVRNFVAFKKGMVLKLTLRCLLKIGYQCTFGVLQAGNYGVPQTRRRLIILASAPGYKLPLYPEPTHVFSRRACTLSVAIDGKRFISNIFWDESAPRRTCTIRDAMSDLPFITNGAMKPEIDYGSGPKTHFQRQVRSKDPSARLRDHICKNMAPLIQARIQRIPTTPGSDWRDLPNISVTLSDGTRSKVLQYRHHDTKNGRGPKGALRGVCACASKKPCTPFDKQDNTLIPWCLPHTGNRHNHWAGLYGRVSWDGYFSTTVTDPEPMGKQGRILHPEQNRVVSVRECARSQGFPDCYIFAGTIQDKHRQIGNAVPPPLGAALGREIKRAITKL